MTSNQTASDAVYTGIITFRPGSLTPVIRMQKDDGDCKFISILVECYEQARGKEGQEVRFTILKNPYQYIVSDYGFANIL